ncbi:unnamed protein product, partial [marine sediment metagenome]
NPSGLVTRVECNRISGETRRELTIIKNALVGEDLRHGLVKEVGDIKRDTRNLKKILNSEQEEVDEKQKLAMKYKITIVGALVSSLTLIGLKIIEVASTLL